MILTFDDLRQANMRRLPQFKNARGERAHKYADGSDWSLGDWMTALTGEVGEAANIIKKICRDDFTLDVARPDLADEFADIVTYLDLLAFRCDINLGKAVRRKFNLKSIQVGSDVRL